MTPESEGWEQGVVNRRTLDPFTIEFTAVRAGEPVATVEMRHPHAGMRIVFGGTPAGNARACADSWREVLAFLGEALAAR